MNSPSLCRTVIIGGVVGKTCFLKRYVNGSFNTTEIATIGIDFKVIERHSVKHQIWDSAGAERFHNVTCGYLDFSDYVLVLYSKVCPQLLQTASMWIARARQYNYRIPRRSGLPPPKVILVATQTDLAVNDVNARRSRRVFSFVSCFTFPSPTLRIMRDVPQDVVRAILEFVPPRLPPRLPSQNEVSKEEALKFAVEHDCYAYFETSAKDNIGIDEIFQYISSDFSSRIS